MLSNGVENGPHEPSGPCGVDGVLSCSPHSKIEFSCFRRRRSSLRSEHVTGIQVTRPVGKERGGISFWQFKPHSQPCVYYSTYTTSTTCIRTVRRAAILGYSQMADSIPMTSSSWAITDTANKTVTFATGMLEAATSDNIHPITLKCCESFGSLLPLCTETRVKVEQLARRNHISHVLNFVKAQIGYRKGDSVELLSRSDSGVRFLALATTFCTTDRYDAADRLDALLQATAEKDQIRPTIKQLQVMMQTITTKMMLSDYANSIVGWEIFSRAMLADYGPDYAIDSARIPSKKSLQDVILALSELCRIGELQSTEIKLKPEQLPWTGAFIQWCLGISPNVRTSSGKSLSVQQDSPVTLTVMPGTWNPMSRRRQQDAIGGDLQVAVQKPLRRFEEIVFLEDSDSKKRSWQSLVDAQTWVQHQFLNLHARLPETQTDKRLQSAIGQALYFIIVELPERLLLCYNLMNLLKYHEDKGGPPDDLFHASSPQPFLDATTRLQVAHGLLDNHIALTREDSDFTKTLKPTDLAEILRGVCQTCASGQHGLHHGRYGACRVDLLLALIGRIGSALLTLTLFGSRPELYPCILALTKSKDFPSRRCLNKRGKKFVEFGSDWCRLVTTQWYPLMNGRYQFLSCKASDLFADATTLMGHPPLSRESTIISSGYGQVVFPAFFEANDFMREGYMQLCAFPGRLRKDDMDFECLIDAVHNYELDIDFEDEGSGTADDLENLDDWLTESDDEDGDQLSDTRDNQEARDVDRDEAARQEHGAIRVEQANKHEVKDTSESEPGEKAVPIAFSAAERHIASSNDRLEWRVAIEDEVLLGEMFLTGKHDEPIRAWPLIESLSTIRLTPVCKHKYSRPAGDIGAQFRLSTEFPRAECRGGILVMRRTLLNAGRSYAKQLTFLKQRTSYPPTVVHVDGCIRCALQFCLDGRCRVVIS